jgi:predicted dehydrogenase
MEKKGFSRRGFLSSTALGALGTLGAAALITSCSKSKKLGEAVVPPLLDKAPDGKPLRAGLIGCGGRGSGAAKDFLSAGPNLQIVALGDLFEDRLKDCRDGLKKEKNVDVADDKCFLGFDAYQKVIACDVDIVILATPPHFRPMHFAAAVEAGKNVFMEKPVAVDPVGARSIMASSKKAEAKGLTVICGTQRRHQKQYVEVYKQIMNGTIGEIVSANVYWNQSQLWFKSRQEGWSDMEWMIRDWVNWSWLSGDHIVEQHVHNIDVAHWFMGKHPVKAVAFGGRHRRVTGDQYDMFSVDYVFEDGKHLHSMCRQIDGCENAVWEYFQGTDGYATCNKSHLEFKIYKNDGTLIWEYAYPKDEKGEPTDKDIISPYVQEHIDFVTCIRQNTPVVEAEGCAVSTLTGIMGRISAYTGKQVTWEEMMTSPLELKPKEYALGPQDMASYVVPVPGSPKEEEKKEEKKPAKK